MTSGLTWEPRRRLSADEDLLLRHQICLARNLVHYDIAIDHILLSSLPCPLDRLQCARSVYRRHPAPCLLGSRRNQGAVPAH